MSTKIEWCTETWNPIVGCTKVSPGCDNCYAEKMAYRLAAMAIKNPLPATVGKYVRVIKGRKWNGTCEFDEVTLRKPLSWRKPRMIFVCSMGDLFHDTVSFSNILEVMFIANKCPQHTFLLLTKRPERMKEFFTEWAPNPFFEPLPNVWLGVTAENQYQANKRVPLLLATPAAKRFVSVEPMLSQIDLVNVYGDAPWTPGTRQLGHIDWVICGGESGLGARPMHPDWVRFLQAECHCAGVPFFFKQWGEWGQIKVTMMKKDSSHKNIKKLYCIFPGEPTVVMAKMGKKLSGNLLDGRLYNEYPKSVL